MHSNLILGGTKMCRFHCFHITLLHSVLHSVHAHPDVGVVHGLQHGVPSAPAVGTHEIMINDQCCISQMAMAL